MLLLHKTPRWSPHKLAPTALLDARAGVTFGTSTFTITSTGAATNGQAITFTRGGSTIATLTAGTEWAVSATVGTQAANIRDAINAAAGLSGLASATASSGTVTVTITTDTGANLGVTENCSNVALGGNAYVSGDNAVYMQISSWASQIGSVAFAQATAAAQPLWAPSYVNGGPTVVFKGAQWLTVTGLSWVRPLSFCLGAKSTAAGTFIGGATDPNRFVFDRRSTPDYRLYNSTNVAGGTPDSNWHTFVVAMQSSNSSAIYLDSSTAIASGASGTNNTYGTVVLGAIDASGTAPMTGAMTHAIFHASRLWTAAEIARIGRWSGRRIGQAWTA